MHPTATQTHAGTKHKQSGPHDLQLMPSAIGKYDDVIGNELNYLMASVGGWLLESQLTKLVLSRAVPVW